jgi:hypothetical protein
MRAFEAALGVAIIVTVLWDAFEALVLPRRVTRKFRLARLYYRVAWGIWSAVAERIRPGKFRETFLSVFGPLSLLALFVLWAAGMVCGFALVHAAVGGAVASDGEPMSPLMELYLSGTTFFTLGLGDILPRTTLERMVMVVESGLGFGFLALVIGYLPILYQSFSRREIIISLMDARGGSPPTASELLKRFGREEQKPALNELLREWESWAAQILESHISYPILQYFRSQHDNQSWLGTMLVILDTSALCLAASEKGKYLQAKLTFAMARHAVTDMAQAVNARPVAPHPDRLPTADQERLRAALAATWLSRACPGGGDAKASELLGELRRMYEPYINGLALWLLVSLPPWVPAGEPHYNWRTTAWERSLDGLADETAEDERDDHR